MLNEYAYDRVKNRVSSLTDSQKSALAGQNASLWRNWTNQIQALITESAEYWQMYNANKPKYAPVNDGNDSKALKEGKRTGVRLGKIARSLDSIHSVQHNSTFPSDDSFFEGTPNNDKAREYQEEYETWAGQNIIESGFIEAEYNHRKNSMVDGTAVSACPYVRKTKRHISYEFPKLKLPFTEIELTLDFLPAKKVIDEKYVYYEGTVSQPLNFNDWRADPNVDNFQEAGFIRRWYLPTWQVKRDFELEEDVASYYDTIQMWDNDREKRETAGINWEWTIGKTEVEGKSKAMLMIRYDTFLIEGEAFENYVCITLNDTEVIFWAPLDELYDHGRKPYKLTPYISIPGQLYGKSALKDSVIMGHTQDNAATLFIDIMSWGTSPVFLKNVNDPYIKSLGSFEVKPGMTIPVDTMNAIEQLAINVGNAEFLLKMVEMLDQQIENAMGSNPAIAGQDPSTESIPTAFQVGAHIQGANNNFTSFMTIYNKTSLAPFLEMKWENDRQFMSKSYQVAGFEEELTPDVVKQMDMDWIITAGEAALARSKRVANLKELITILPQWKAAGLVTFKQEVAEVDFIGVIQSLLEESGMQDADRIIKVISNNQEVTQAASGEPMQEGSPNEPEMGNPAQPGNPGSAQPGGQPDVGAGGAPGIPGA